MDDMDPEADDDVLPKPDELLALHSVTAALFVTLKRWFDVGDTVELDISEIDSAVSELGDPQMIASMAMRKLQALNLIATPGVRTSTDMVITIVNDLDRALLQAPAMYLSRQAEGTDWDAALAGLGADGSDAPDDAVPVASDDTDPELEEFHVQHSALHEAVHAVVEAAQGEIRYFE